MTMRWIHESLPVWDAKKAEIFGAAGPGVFDPTLTDRSEGQLLPGDWWRVEEEGQTVGYACMDVIWGDAEMLLAVAPECRRKGVGTFILDRLEEEARHQGLNYLFNAVRTSHPQHDEVSEWLRARNFVAYDERLMRSVVRPVRAAG